MLFGDGIWNAALLLGLLAIFVAPCIENPGLALATAGEAIDDAPGKPKLRDGAALEDAGC